MPKVYVTQHGSRKVGDTWEKRDISAATKFGELVELLPAGPMIRAPAQVTNTLRDKLAWFSDEDYLLCMGDPTLIGLSCVMAARANHGRYRLLVWDRHTADYYEVPVDTAARLRDHDDNT